MEPLYPDPALQPEGEKVVNITFLCFTYDLPVHTRNLVSHSFFALTFITETVGSLLIKSIIYLFLWLCFSVGMIQPPAKKERENGLL